MLGIEVLDHVIIGEGRHFSFADSIDWLSYKVGRLSKQVKQSGPTNCEEPGKSGRFSP